MKLKWIKLPVDLYFSPKLRLLGDGERGSVYRLIYVYMLCLAGKEGKDGALMLSATKPYSADMLARIFDISKETVDEALLIMSELGLIRRNKRELRISDWDELQSIEDKSLELTEEERSEFSDLKNGDNDAKKSKSPKKVVRTNTDKATTNTNKVTTNTNKVTTNTDKVTTNTDSEPYKYLSLDKNKNKNRLDYI